MIKVDQKLRINDKSCENCLHFPKNYSKFEQTAKKITKIIENVIEIAKSFF